MPGTVQTPEALLDSALIRRVWERAKGRCEYCQLSQEHDDRPFEIDHIISRKHHGPTAAGNLALSCFRCNSFEGSDISGRDPKTRRLTRLFHPRRHKWARHFRWQGAKLAGYTPVGRVTVVVLKINDGFRVELRKAPIEEGVFPPA
jgi:hypothetical protein